MFLQGLVLGKTKTPTHLWRLARILKFLCKKFSYHTFNRLNNKGADETVQMCRLVCAFDVPSVVQQKWDLLTTRPILSHDVTPGSDIMPCNKIDIPLVVYRFSNFT